MSPLSSTLIESPPAWSNYLDLANDIKPYLQIPSTDTARDVQLQEVIDSACWWVQDYLGRPIAPTEFFRRFSSWGVGSIINLPYYPVLQVVGINEWWGANGPNPLTEQIPSNQGSQQVYQVDALHGQIIRSFTGLIARPFFPGLRNIEITWIAGFNPVPRTVIMATKELVKYWWVNTQQASRSAAARPAGVEYDDTGNTMLWPAIPNRVTMLLETLNQVGIG